MNYDELVKYIIWIIFFMGILLGLYKLFQVMGVM